MAIIKTGLQDLLMSAATLQGKCFIVNGLDRNTSYNGWVDPVNMSISAPPAAAAMATSVASQGTITITGVPSGTFVIDDQTFTWVASRAGIGQVTIGSGWNALAWSRSNLVDAVNADLSTVTAVSKAEGAAVITATVAGASGNNIIFTEDSTVMTMDGSGTLGGTTEGSGDAFDIAGSLIVGGIYKVKFEYYNKDRGVPSGMSPSVTITCPSLGGFRIAIPANSGVDSQVTHIRAYLTANGGSVFRLDDADGKEYTGSEITYDFTAAKAARLVAMGELATDGKSNIDIHGIFPTVKYLMAFKDRVWGLGTEVFSTGTASVANGDKTVIITGGVLPTGIVDGVTHFHIDGDSEKYLIDTRTDDTHFELINAYNGTIGTGKTFYIYGEDSYLYYSYIKTSGIPYPESWAASHFLPIGKGDNDICTGIGTAHNQIVVFKTRRTVIVSGTSQSNYIATTITTELGCVSGYTIDNNSNGDLLYLSEKGLCLTNGNEIVNLSESQIGNIFTGEGNPPWTVEKSLLSSACGAYDTLTNRYRLFITEDGETQNIRRVVYDFNKVNGVAIGWYEEDGIVARCCGILEDSDGSPKVSFGCDGGANGDKAYVYQYDEDVTNDGAGTTSTKRGTATAADATSLTDSAATFTDGILGCNCSIISGTGSGQAVRRIYTRDSATKFTIETAWATTPDTTSVYAIGAIDAYRQFKWMDFGALGSKILDKIILIFKQAAYSCYVKVFNDYSTTEKIDKTMDLDTSKGYRMLRIGQNRARLHQLKIGLNDVDKPIVIKEVKVEFRGVGKPSEFE